jgi:Domain of unknown function (DUF3291)
MKSDYHLAQVNVGKILAPMDSPLMSEFKNNLDRINALAEASEGFVWRLKEENNNATSIKVFEDDFMLINMSVWKDMDALYKYVYESAHVEYLKKRREWFERLSEIHMAMWWIPAGHIPSPAEAIERLTHMREKGDTPYAFGFKKRFTPEELTKKIL